MSPKFINHIIKQKNHTIIKKNHLPPKTETARQSTATTTVKLVRGYYYHCILRVIL
ncbi:hypothetical protein L963_1805 [Leuconostoc mesenteroides subsp. cremoris T26]|nr:hypothetical protein L963_1805 [Leuconostoc mesenteroides subsp. cremoris T26]